MAIYQEKNKNKLPKNGNSWYYRCYYTDMYGNRKQKQSKMYLTKKEAKDAETDFLSKIKTTDEVDFNVSFETVYNEWLNFKKNYVKITTFYCISKTLDKHLLTYFKDYKLQSIKINILNNWKNNIVKKNLSISKKNMIISYFKELLNYANIYYDFDNKITNSLIKIRDDKPIKIINDSEKNFLTKKEFDLFISNVNNDYYSLIFNFLYRTGLRIGELRALTWEDINLINKTLNINKSMSDDTFDAGSIIVTTKTDNSVRIIDLDDYLIKMVKDYKETQIKLYGFNGKWLIFGGLKHLGLTTLRRRLNHYLELSKVKNITLHGFRHSHASLLIYLGCDSRDVADRLGDTVQVVERTYAHLFPEKRKSTIEKLNNL